MDEQMKTAGWLLEFMGLPCQLFDLGITAGNSEHGKAA